MKQKLEDKCEVKQALEMKLSIFLKITERHYKSRVSLGCYACNGYDKNKVCYLKDDKR